MKPPIYLDYNATTPVDPAVAATMQPFVEQQFGNPSSQHAFGQAAKSAIEKARIQLAAMLNCFPDEVTFTSGGTESNNMAIKGVAFRNKHLGNHIITSAIEHPAVIEVCRFLETQGFKVSYITVDKYGLVDPARIADAITKQTILISIMHANNEIGTIQPITEIGRIASLHNIPFHCDAAQSIGKIKVDVQDMHVDLLSLAGHKLYAPKGIGALFIRRGIELQKFMHGATHEHDLRAGTENVIQIVGLGKAAELINETLERNAAHMKACKDILQIRLSETIPDAVINGHPVNCLPNTLSVSIPGIDANTLLDSLHQVAASAGAACHATDITISPVLQAIQHTPSLALGTIRLSTGRFLTESEAHSAADQIVEAIEKMRPTDTAFPEALTYNDTEQVKLTRYTHGMGCACKIQPQYLESLLKDMPPITDKCVLVGPQSSDDAAVYKINDNQAIVQTVDFFTPIVDDPYMFGAIAAANALSDIYAMGAKPVFALNIVGFPSRRLPVSVLKEIMKGAADKASEAGIHILGGHTVEDNEPKFGMVVTGLVHPEQIITNAGAVPGDVLLLTKPIGTGIISTAIKRGLATEESTRNAHETMLQLNDKAAMLMHRYKANACTDVTGFGLLGHLKEMVSASKVAASVYADAVPILPGTYELAVAGAIPGGSRNNLNYVADALLWHKTIPDHMKLILSDAQTSGGLLISLPEEQADGYITSLMDSHQIRAVKIGVINAGKPGTIEVL